MIAIPLADAPFEPGTRVGLFASYQLTEGKKVLKLYGWGVYEGDFPLGDKESTESCQTAKEKMKLFEECGKISAPRLRQDDGTVTWGLLVWWDTEDVIKDYVSQADTVEEISLADAMTKFNDGLTNRKGFREAVEDINVFNPKTINSPGN